MDPDWFFLLCGLGFCAFVAIGIYCSHSSSEERREEVVSCLSKHSATVITHENMREGETSGTLLMDGVARKFLLTDTPTCALHLEAPMVPQKPAKLHCDTDGLY